MTWFGWTLIFLTCLGVLLQIAAVGKPRQPISAGTAIGSLIVNTLVVVAILTVGTGTL